MMNATIRGAPMWMKASSVNRRLLTLSRIEEVADQRAIEQGQHVEPLGGGDDHELRELVPHQHEAVDAGNVHQPQQGHAGQPGERTKAAIAVVGKVPQHVQQHRQDHAVSRVAVDAAQDAARPPLVVGDPLDRLESVVDAGIGEDVEVQAGSPPATRTARS
jgi:hypothetical protein